MGNHFGGHRTAAALAAGGVVSLLGGVLGACGGPPHKASTAGATTTSLGTTTTTAKARLVAHAAVCPLTGAPPPHGEPPHRPALAVKVENLPQARPQWGLDKADVVFEEPVEGGITRFVAVFQCQGSDRIEPVRSGRLVDVQILQPLGKTLFAYAGAIQPVMAEVDAPGSLLEDIGIDRAPNAYWRDPTRQVPHNLETSTKALYQAAASAGYTGGPPSPIFSYGPLPPGGRRVGAFDISYPLDVTTWTWDAPTGRWTRSYSDTGLAMLGNNVQISAANVVVMSVDEYPTQYVEDGNGAYENELTLTGSGKVWVLRDGMELQGRWERPSLAKEATFVEADGTRITLTPGNTWVEYVPVGRSVTAVGAGTGTASPAATGGTSTTS
jgi:hypothetical protein